MAREWFFTSKQENPWQDSKHEDPSWSADTEPFSDIFLKMVQLRATRCFSGMISSLLGEVIHAKPHFAKYPPISTRTILLTPPFFHWAAELRGPSM